MSATLNAAKEEIKMRLSLSSVVGEKAKLTRAGREFKACCPFHNEKTPSFYVNDDKQFYHCFGCGAHGDHFTFVMAADKLTFFEAMEQLALKAGVTLPQPDAQDIEADKARERLYQVNDAAATLFESLLHTNGNAEVMQYLTARGLSEETLRNFRLGYAPQDGGFLVKYLTDQGFTAQEMVDAGLARQTEGRTYSFFRDRVMFPVADRRGRVIAFGGRTLPEHLRPPSDKAPKYLNTGDTPLFHKSKTLYAQALARQGAIDKEPLIVVEGYMDAIALHQHGFKGAVAPLGTALTEGQIEILWSMDHGIIKEPILAFDGDKAGRSAAVRAVDRVLPLLKPGHSLKVLFLPEGDDPDTLLLRQGPPAMRMLLNQATPLVDFLWDHWRAQMRLDTPEARAQARAMLRDHLNVIADNDIKTLYKQELSGRLDALIAPSPQNSTRSFSGSFKPKTQVGPRPSAAPMGNAALDEQILLAVLLTHPQVVEHVEEQLGSMELGDSLLDKLRELIISESSNWAAFSAAEACAYSGMKGFGDLVTRLMSNRVLVHTGFARGNAALPDIAAGWLDVYARRQGAQTANDATNNRAASPLERLKRLSRATQAANDTVQEG